MTLWRVFNYLEVNLPKQMKSQFTQIEIKSYLRGPKLKQL